MNSGTNETEARKQAASNRRVALVCGGIFTAMVGASFAAVPLYQLFCQVTGFGGTTQRAESDSATVIDRQITVRFDGNINGELPWSFKPLQRSVTLRMGETMQVAYEASNTGPDMTMGTSVFNVTPFEAGAYFNKMQCFCFTEQALASGETVEMPVVFFVDPAMDEDPDLKHVKEITLSYTFYSVQHPVKPVAARPADPAVGSNL
ncbi:cytochrome c oxidase assembly protein [Pannonibacter sp. Pt2-lr]